MSDMNFAHLPGVGLIESPQPEHYEAAIQWLHNDLRSRLPVGYDRRCRGQPDLRFLHLVALQDTLRRLQWTPERLRMSIAA